MPDLGDAGPARAWEALEPVKEDPVDYNAGEHCQQVSGNQPVGFCRYQDQGGRADQVICNDLGCSDMPLTVDEQSMVEAQAESSA